MRMPGRTRKRPTKKQSPAIAERREASASPTPELATAKRGRPARLSRQRIVDAVLVLLERDPRSVPTISTIAREVEAVPAALYRHFESFEEILDGVMAGILAASPASPDGDASWPRQLERWMRDLRHHLLRYPAILAMIGRSGRTSPAWLEASSALVEILARAGLAGRELAATYLWVLETTVGLVLQEAVMPLTDQFAGARAARHAFSPAARERFATIEREIERIDGETFFDFAVEQAIAGIEVRIRREPRARSKQPGRKHHVD
jgi:AcrR family transcriptional regulator